MYKRWRFGLVLMILALLLGAAQPGLAADAPLATPHTFWDVMEVAQQARGSVVGVLVTLPPVKQGGLTRMASGSGVVYRDGGYIVTNAHVVYGATEVSVLTPEGKIAKVAKDDVLYDYVSDVAVLRVPGTTLKTPTWADSDKLKVGELAIAVGNPLGFRLGNTVSVGVVSGLGRSLGTGYPFIQHDASTNSGNSGGPLLNADGQVIGINSGKVARVGVEGLSFAIPANVVKTVADTLIKEKKIVRVWLGLTLYESDAAYYGIPTNEGLEVGRVHETTPAYGKVNKGDIIEAVNGKAVHTLDDVSEQLKSVKAGQAVRLSLKRGTSTLEATVTAAEMPNRPLDEEDPSLQVAGIWRNMTDAQIEKAIDDGYDSLRQNFNKVAADYIQKNAKAAVFFQTEYMHVMWSIWGRVRNGKELEANFEMNAAKEIRGKFEVHVMLPKKDVSTFVQVTATLEQGNLKVPGTVINDMLHMNPPDFWPDHDYTVNAFHSEILRFDSTKFDLKQPVTLKLKTSDGVEASYAFPLESLR